MRESESARAIESLAAGVDPQRFAATFGAGLDQLDLLVANQTVTIAHLMEISPPGTVDPTSGQSGRGVMGSYINLIVLAPGVTRDEVERFATRARQAFRFPATFILCDLTGRRVRRDWLIQARDAGLRILDLDIARDVDRRALRLTRRDG